MILRLQNLSLFKDRTTKGKKKIDFVVYPKIVIMMEVQTKRIHIVLTPDCFWLLHPNLHAPLIYISKHQRNLENVCFNFDFD